MSTWKIRVRWDVNRTSENRTKSANRFARNALHQAARTVARCAWLEAGAPKARGPVKVSVTCRRGRSMDVANIIGGLKPLLDGLFVRGITQDDSARWVTLGGVTQETGARWKTRPEVEFVVEELE